MTSFKSKMERLGWRLSPVIQPMCATQTGACVATFSSQEVLIHAGIMHDRRLWHLSALQRSPAHLFGNGFTYIFSWTSLPPPPLPPFSQHIQTGQTRNVLPSMIRNKGHSFSWCSLPSVGHVRGFQLACCGYKQLIMFLLAAFFRRLKWL